MISPADLHKIQDQVTAENMARLVAEIERLQRLVRDMSASVEEKLQLIECDRAQLDAENARLLTLKETLGVERDACVGLIARMAPALGHRTGLGAENRVVVDLPGGQVSWQYEDSEAHLFAHLGTYDGSVEELPLDETYRRVMNPGL